MSTRPGGNIDWRQVCRLSRDPYLVISTASAQFPILECSEGYLRAVGVRREDVIGRSAFELLRIEEALASSTTRELRSMLEVGLTQARVTMRDDDAPRLSDSGHNMPVFDETGRLTCVMHRIDGVGDITRRHVWQRVHQRDEELFQAAPLAIALLHGPDHVFGLSNAEHRKLMGDLDVVGKSATEALPRWAADALLPELDRVRRNDAPSLHIPMAREDRDPRGGRRALYYSASILPFHDRFGEVEGEAIFAFDVTAYVQSQRKDRFLAVLGHELRNPLAPIQSVAEFLRMPELQGDAARLRHLGDVLHRQVHQLTRMVDDLLDISRINEGRLKLSMEPVYLRDVLDAAIDTCQNAIDRRKQGLILHRPSSGVSIRVDRARFTQVLVNLLSNASRYTPEDGEIRISTRIEGEWLEFEVADNGCGIDPTYLPLVFESFSRADWEVDDHRGGGLGLGLSLVRRIVEMHGGEVDAFSDGPGCGSVFVVRAPVVVDILSDQSAHA